MGVLLAATPSRAGRLPSFADLTVCIAKCGSTRSINVGVAAGIVMHAWVAQYGETSAAPGEMPSKVYMGDGALNARVFPVSELLSLR